MHFYTLLFGISCVLLSFIPALQTQIVSILRSVNGAARPCGLAVREQHKMLFVANKLEKEKSFRNYSEMEKTEALQYA